MKEPLIDLRRKFHAELIEANVLSIAGGVVSNADKSSAVSKRLGLAIFDQIQASLRSETQKVAGQTAGQKFELACANFIDLAFSSMRHIRPGEWLVGCDGVQGRTGVTQFAQYKHLATLAAISETNPELRSAIGTDYLIKPDVIVAQRGFTDAELNAQGHFVDGQTAGLTPLRAANSQALILHASISCKWTMRSDRAQNARTEALNLMKNRKGRVPHIVAITAEPTPGRIASLAFGTGELDCVYHFALPELVKAVSVDPSDDATLTTMIEGGRLRDISDLPFDLLA